MEQVNAMKSHHQIHNPGRNSLPCGAVVRVFTSLTDWFTVRPMRKVLLTTGFCAGMVCSLSVPAAAQSIDYNALETLFGEPVTMSATGKPQRASEVPATMEIITADDIRRSGATNIPDILRHYAGINVWQW